MTLEMKFQEYEEAGRQKGREEGRQEGRQEGRLEGKKIGMELSNQLFARLLKDGRTEDALKATQDQEYRMRLMKEYSLA